MNSSHIVLLTALVLVLTTAIPITAEAQATYPRLISVTPDTGTAGDEMNVEGETLVIKVDLTKEFGPSKSGKTIMVASTEGNVSVPDRDEKIGLNVYRYPV